MAGRTRRTLVATAPGGTDVRMQTAGDYAIAGLIQRSDGTWFIAAKGFRSTASVYNRTHAIYNRGDYKAMHVSDLIEETAPVLREYFGTHAIVLEEAFRPGSDWSQPARGAGRSVIRQLAGDGYTAVAFRLGTRTADFQMDELLRSMNARVSKA